MSDDFLSQVLAMAKSGKKEAKKSKAKKKKAKKLSEEEKRQQRINPVFRNSPWIPVAIVGLFHISQCKCCGVEQTRPSAKNLFLRYEHRTLGTIWEKEMLDYQTEGELPRERRYFHVSSEYCHECIDEYKRPAPFQKYTQDFNDKKRHDLDVVNDRYNAGLVASMEILTSKELIPISQIFQWHTYGKK
jgi:hypothetical protein